MQDIMRIIYSLVILSTMWPLLTALYRYGDVSQGAAFPCRCDGDCYPDNGTCVTGECQDVNPPGFKWSGEGCRIGNVALGQPAFHIHTWSDQPAYLAVNGKIGPNRTSGECSYTGRTNDHTPAWWYVDLGSVHVIYSVTIYNFRDSTWYHLISDFDINIGNNTVVSKNQLCGTRIPKVSDGGNAKIPCSEPMYGRYVGYQSRKPRNDRNAKWVSICEFVVIGRSTVECGRCPGEKHCDDYHGCEQCTNGSLIADCKRDCPSGKYGINCIEKCSSYCKDEQACDKSNGDCLEGCREIRDYIQDAWWIGQRCDIHIPQVPVSPIMNLTASGLTTSSVTIQWTDTLNIFESIHHIFGYNVYLRNESMNWTWQEKMPYGVQLGRQSSLINLEAQTSYQITIVVFRNFTNGTEYQIHPGDDPSQVINVTTLSPPTPTTTTTVVTSSMETVSTESWQSGGSDGVSVGAVVGGVMGGLVLFIVVVVVTVIVLRRRRGERKEDGIPRNTTDDDIAFYPFAEVNAKTCTTEADTMTDRDGEEIYENARRSILIANTSIQIKGLQSFLDKKRDNYAWFKDEFKALPQGQVLECEAASRPTNVEKNRFRNIKPYDSTIIELENGNDQSSTYINANFITGFGEKKKMYAATQGPKPETVNDFWRLLWTLQSSRIVMLTGLFESGKDKCALYWPEEVGLSKNYGALRVTNMASDEYADYAHRVFKVEKGVESLTVHHYQYLHWPDKSVPKETYPLIALRHIVRSQDEYSTGPLVVHCSAGVGRTGTFIAIDCLMEQAESDKEIDVVKVATQMRLERTLMIQTLPQYVFVYDAILDATTCGRTAVPVAILEKEWVGQDKSVVDTFSLLSKLRQAKPQIHSDGQNPEHDGMNRDSSIIPSDSDRPRLAMTSAFQSDYINAVFVNSFKVRHGMIATQTPLAETVVDFWRLVYDHNCDVIVMLNDKVDVSYWEDDSNVSQTQGPYEILMKSVKEKGNLILRKFSLVKTTSSRSRISPRHIHHVHFTEWNKDTHLPNKRSLFELFDYIDALNPKNKLLVHCSNGASRCGLFCAARYMLEKMSVEKEEDVFLAVRSVSSVRDQFVDSIEQYLYLHELALEYNSRFATYENI